MGFAWLIRRIWDLMIEFIGPLYNWLQQFTNHCRTQSSYSDWTLYGIYSDFPLNCQLKDKITLRLMISQSVSQVSKSWCRAPSGAHDQIFITVWQLQSWFCGAPSLMRGRVCLLYMLLGLPNAVFLASESLGTRDHILLSQIWDFPFHRLLRLTWLLSSLYNLGTDHTERIPPLLTDMLSSCCLVMVCVLLMWQCSGCHENVFTGCWLAMENFLLNYFGFQPSCHDIISVLSSDLFWHVYKQHRYRTYHEHDE
jgi:hypothetical protein